MQTCVTDGVCLVYGESSMCSLKCDPTRPFCEDGARSLCVAVRDRTYGACADFGAGEEGALCDGVTDCEPQMACVRGPLDDQPRCLRVCDFEQRAAPCPAGRSCVPFSTVTAYGYCSVTP